MERDENWNDNEMQSSNFNSRAHVERDELTVRTVAVLDISTHALTWSATARWLRATTAV